MADKNVQLTNYEAQDKLYPKTDASLVSMTDEDGDSSTVKREIETLRAWEDRAFVSCGTRDNVAVFLNTRSAEIGYLDLTGYALKTNCIADVTFEDNVLTFDDTDGNTITTIDLSELTVDALSEDDVIAASEGEESASKGFLDYTGLRKVFELLKGMFLRVDELQNLSDEQKEIARANLGIDSGGSSGDITYYVSESRDADIEEGASYSPSSSFEYEMGLHNVTVYVDGILALESIEWQEESTTSIKFLGDVSKDSTIAIYVRG